VIGQLVYRECTYFGFSAHRAVQKQPSSISGWQKNSSFVRQSRDLVAHDHFASIGFAECAATPTDRGESKAEKN